MESNNSYFGSNTKQHCSQYLEMLRDAGPKAWIFEEYRDLSAIQFRYFIVKNSRLWSRVIFHVTFFKRLLLRGAKTYGSLRLRL